MNRSKQLLTSAIRDADIHTEPLPGVPLIEIYGQKRVLIEQHKGIVGYGCNEILVNVRHGRICIGGECLKLVKMSQEKLVITGNIHSVTLQGRA